MTERASVQWLRRATNDSKAVPVAAEEGLQVLEASRATRHRCTGGDDAQLVRVRGEANAIEKYAEEVRDLRARGPAVRVQLV
ncbi:MAG: hypothetical protein L6Q76_33510, partial [Polyangiaceae bacterium]|nr:hypothetical protein [Polyangiaceae bacterium]